MFEPMDWERSLRKLLGAFVMAIRSFIDQLPGMSKSDIEKKLKEYGEKLDDSSNGFSKVKLAYKNAVEAYLNRFPPAFSNDDKLIVLSLRSGNKAILSEWGIQKLPRNCIWFNDPLERSKYVQGLEDLRDRTSGAEEYYDYLIHYFR
jgi:hypothetical protein